MESAIKVMDDKQKQHSAKAFQSPDGMKASTWLLKWLPFGHISCEVINSTASPEQWWVCTCARRRRLAHAGRIAAGVGNLLRQFLLGAPVCLVVLLLVLDQDFTHQLHGAGKGHSRLQLAKMKENNHINQIKVHADQIDSEGKKREKAWGGWCEMLW